MDLVKTPEPYYYLYLEGVPQLQDSLSPTSAPYSNTALSGIVSGPYSGDSLSGVLGLAATPLPWASWVSWGHSYLMQRAEAKLQAGYPVAAFINVLGASALDVFVPQTYGDVPFLFLGGVGKVGKYGVGAIGRGGIKATKHGAERLAKYGFTEAEIAATKLGRIMTQADGAKVFIKEVAIGKFNVIVEGERGIITAMKNLDQRALNNLSKNYGWR